MQYPWVGNKYGILDNTLSGKRILIVGESHYTDDKKDIGKSIPNITQEVVRKYQSGEYRIPFFTRISTMITGIPAWKNGEKSKELWNELSFYNYVPVIAASGPREFEWSLWGLGENEFNTVLEDVDPDLIVVSGYRLWDNAYIRHTDGSVSGGQRVNMVTMTKNKDKLVPTLIIRHPSAPGFSGMQQHSSFKELFDSI